MATTTTTTTTTDVALEPTVRHFNYIACDTRHISEEDMLALAQRTRDLMRCCVWCRIGVHDNICSKLRDIACNVSNSNYLELLKSYYAYNATVEEYNAYYKIIDSLKLHNIYYVVGH